MQSRHENSPSNNDDLLLTRRLDLEGWFSAASLDIFLSTLDVDRSILLDDIESVEMIWCRGVFNITSLHVEAGYFLLDGRKASTISMTDLHAMGK